MTKLFPSLALSVLALCLNAHAAEATQKPQNDQQEDHLFKNLRFRNLGPAAAGGRVTSVVGIPGDPNTYYAGGAAGGVWKSDNAGTTWRAIFEHEKTASIGSIALAPSNPNFVWVGTGEANIRNDITDGAGVYFSPDAGASWQFKGLADAGQISRVVVDPKNPNIVFVGAIGHAWAPNAERGLFRTTDGGATWKKVLFVDDTTGVADLAMQPGNSMVLYAAMWHVRRYPWTLVDGGESSGLYRSTDGGDTWKKLTEGLPKGPLGRIAVAIAPSNPRHLYALVAAEKGMLWESHDMGDHWSAVTDNHALDVRPFYFSRMAVSPVDENKIFFLSFNLMESEDGGKTAHEADRGVHPDHHTIWIDPENPDRIIQGNDGGVFISHDGAKSWRFLDGLPLEQLYQVAADSETPYNVCGGLQDNSSWCGPSSDYGRSGVTNADWYTVVGGDGEYAVPAPSDPNIVYTDSQQGDIFRLDKKLHYARFIRPYLSGVEEAAPSQLKYRFNWTTPIAVSQTNANEVYLGANVLFKTTDGGGHWTVISPDLTRNDKSKQQIAGGPVNHDISSAENYGTIISITIATTDPKVVWVGTDDGCIQLTRDGGANWSRVDSAIKGAPEWERVYQIGVSPFDAGTAYVTFDGHMLDDRHPHVYKTSDYGKTWQSISAGLPESPVFVVREDPNQRGVLVLGNDQGLWISHDVGARWEKIRANFPTVPVWDVQFVGRCHDLLVATHGRGIFVFDNFRLFENWSPDLEASAFHLIDAGNGTAFHHWDEDEGNPVSFSTPNAPGGAPIDYYLKQKIEFTPEQKASRESPVKIVITDSNNKVVSTEYGTADEGVNRFVWDLRHGGIRVLESSLTPRPLRPGELERARYYTRGPIVMPGDYNIAVTVNGQTQTTQTHVGLDPNLHIPLENFKAQTEAALTVQNDLETLNYVIERSQEIHQQLDQFQADVLKDASLTARYSALLAQLKQLKQKIEAFQKTVYNPLFQHNVLEDDIHGLADLHMQVDAVAGALSYMYGEAPNEELRARISELHGKVDEG
ncbi:MAG TPA: hypothetical protein VH325_18455, partial [Bryobacteraceae bacterium]|nr:hypothetical protein [Bryobacteraceae bacterium]